MSDNGRSPTPQTPHLDGHHVKPETIAAYLNQSVPAAERQDIERHLVMCADCRRDLAEATELGVRRRPRWATVGIPAAAAAVLAFALLGPFERTAETGPAAPILRGAQSEGTPTFAALSPADGAAVVADSLVFSWRSEGARVHYLLTVTDRNGDVVWSTETADTTIVLPREIGLEPGGQYFWYVDALLEGARSSTTGVLEFSVAP